MINMSKENQEFKLKNKELNKEIKNYFIKWMNDRFKLTKILSTKLSNKQKKTKKKQKNKKKKI